jgi:hypothetical protein
VVEALRNPTAEFGRYKFRTLFLPRGGHEVSVIPGVGERRLQRVLNRLAGDSEFGRLNWHTELRLGELTQRERDGLVDGLVEEAPATWRAAA